MSLDNVETVRQWVEQFARRTAGPDIQAFVSEFWDPDGDYYPLRKFPDAHPRHGAEDIASFYASYAESWDAYENVIVKIEPIGDDRVFVHTRLTAEGHGTGLPVEGDLYHCAWLRHGRILRCEDHLTEAGARAALGLTATAP